MITTVVTPTASEPITLEEAKAHLRVDLDDDDDLILRAIASARGSVESAVRRALMPQTLETAWSCFPGCGPILLPRAPVRSVVSITYADPSGGDVVLDPSSYRVVLGGTGPAEIVPAVGSAWPSTAPYPDAVRVRYEAGYADAATVPAIARSVLLLRVGTLYEQRESLLTGTIATELSDTQRWLLDPLDWGSYP